MEKIVNEEELFALIKGINDFNKNVELEGKTFNAIVKLPNIGITFYNKLNSIVKQYRNCNLNFYDSYLLLPILNRMSSFMDAAMNTMKNFQEEEEKMLKKIFFNKRKYLDLLNRFVNEYTNIDNGLYQYDIKNDIVNTILYDMLIRMDDDVYNDSNVFLLYEQELMNLGLEENVLLLRKKFEQINYELKKADEKVLKK